MINHYLLDNYHNFHRKIKNFNVSFEYCHKHLPYFYILYHLVDKTNDSFFIYINFNIFIIIF